MKSITYVGIDAHKENLVTVVLRPDGQVLEDTIRNNTTAINRWVKTLSRLADGGEIRACYEAGPTGFGLQRRLLAADIVCEVVAPSLIPKMPGDRVKTDRRDARKLAELFRAGMLTEVRAPTPEEESVRDLCRLRMKAKEDQTRARNRLGKFLLRQDQRYPGKSSWTREFRSWLRTLTFDNEATKLVFEDLLRQCEHLEDRVKALDESIERFAQNEPYASAVAALCCLRGFKTLTAMVVLSELFAFARFESPRALMSYLGLTPSQHSSGSRERRGGITKTGNRFVRRALVEAATHAGRPPSQSRELRERRKGQRADVVTIADRAQHRLNRRYWRLVNAGKAKNVATVAVARELVGFVWSILRTVEFESRTKRCA